MLATDIVSSVDDSTEYHQLEGYSISRRMVNAAAMLFDRWQTFGHEDRLN
ncbi:MAG: hypothetical protein U5J63_09740 [Fodinibius sp.]|nr:hypothetical protein [Fodinibius sp.]